MVVSLQWHGNEIIVKQGLAVEQENADLLINVVMEKNMIEWKGKVLSFHSIFSLNYSSHKSELIERQQTFGAQLQEDNSLKSLIKSTRTELELAG